MVAKKKLTKRQLVYRDLKAIIGKAESISDFMKNIPQSVQECEDYWTTQTRLKRKPKDAYEIMLSVFMNVLRNKYLSLEKGDVSEYFSEYVSTFRRLLGYFRDQWIYEYKISVDFPEYKMYPILSYPVLYRRWAELNPKLAEADALFRAGVVMNKAGVYNSTIDVRLDELLGEGNMNLLKLPCYFYLMEKAEFIKIMNGGK